MPAGVTITPGTTRITGTATDSSGNTSEFGPNRTVAGVPVTAGLVVHLDAGETASMRQDVAGTTALTATGQAVCRWNDLSGRANHATSPAADQCATYQVDSRGGALAFSSNGWYTTSPTLSPDGTVLVVAESGTSTWNTYGWIASARGPNGFIIHPWPGSSVGYYVVNRLATYFDVWTPTVPTPSATTLYTLTFGGTGTVTGTAAYGGTSTTYSVAGVERSAGPVSIRLGADDGYTNRNGNGRYREVLIYDRVLSNAELQQVQTHLRTKWGTG